jgi:GMP synthase-like glutamine amidotransferase
MHRDIVFSQASSTEGLGQTPVCQTQFMYQKGRFITVQGHPEYTKEIVEEILTVRHGMGILTDEVFGSGMKRLTDHDDGVIVAQAFLRFLLED